MEKWKPIKNFEEKYEVSDMGNVRSHDMILPCKNNSSHIRKGKTLIPQKNRNGYLFVNLRGNEHSGKYYIHRLVADAFVLNEKGLPIVNHKNEIKSDNRAENLEWCTNQYNINYGSCPDKIKRKMGSPILQILPDGNTIRWLSIRDIERTKGYSRKIIAACCKGERAMAYNSEWRYIT